VEILGELDDTLTVTSNYIITPFVGVIPCPYEFTLNREETEEIFDVPLSTFLDKSRFREEVFEHEGQPHPVYYYQYEGRVIWGATARILKQCLELVFGNKP